MAPGFMEGFWGSKLQSAGLRAFIGGDWRPDMPADTEVYQNGHFALAFDNDIGWLQVAVKDSPLMDFSESQSGLEDEPGSFSR